MYGNIVPASEYTPLRSVIGEVTSSPAGNLVLRVGREHYERGPQGVVKRPHRVGGWERTEHVVLTPDEAEDFALDILKRLDRDQFEALYARAANARDDAGININDTAVMRIVDAAIG